MATSDSEHPDPPDQPERELSRLEETLWVIQARGGRLDAFTRLVNRYEAPLLYFLRRLIRNPEQALDAYQEVWLDAWRGLPKLLVPEAFRVWIYKIARARAARFIRNEIREHEKLRAFSEADSINAAQPEPTHDAEAVHLALEHLPPDQREVLTLFYLNDLTLEEIASVIERPVGTVKSRLHSARASLRRIIEKGPL